MTYPLTTSKYGGGSIGEFHSGSYKMVSSAEGKTPIQGVTLNILDVKSYEQMATPLSGMNILDYRIPWRSHNNIPPSYNIYVRYKDGSRDVGLVEQMLSRSSAKSTIVPIYQSSLVPNLESYNEENLTSNDFLLRLSLVGNDAVLRKQSV